MDTHKKVLLLGDSALTAVTEAALSAYPNLTVHSAATPEQNSGPCDAIVVVDRLDDCQLTTLIRAYPSIAILTLDWQMGTFSWLVSYSGISLNTDHLLAAIFVDVDLPGFANRLPINNQAPKA
jgi:hypothetical protein